MKAAFSMRKILAVSLPVIALVISTSARLHSQNTGRRAAPLIVSPIDENQRVTLRGNTRPEANAANDLGAVSNNLRLDHMLLQLKRSPQQEQAAAAFVADLHNPQSPNFHKWLTAAEFGKQFGLAESDIRTISAWLESHGFTVNSVYPSGMLIDFSGTAGQLERAFHTAIHNLDVNGARHIANLSDPEIPAALAPAIAGIVSLHDFRPHTMKRAKYTYNFQGTTVQAVVPNDLATIYDLNPLFQKGITGSGQTIAVLEDTDIYSMSDWTTFRSTFGLSQYSSATLTTVNPQPVKGSSNCSDPGVNGDDIEAILDAEWSSAAAPAAAIEVTTCADTDITFGVFIALENAINGSNPPGVMSISYGVCEPENGAASNSAIGAAYQQAVAEGISVFVSAGDEGAAGCDQGAISATHGITVNAFASTPYNVAMGGTDFSDTLDGTANNYWSATNTATYGSALSYVPEIPWNDSCAGSLLASYNGYSTGYGPNGFCNTPTASSNGLLTVAAGSGGPSNCASGSPAQTAGGFGTASGTCQGWAKPSWQAGLRGIPNDGVRDLPDLSLFAADGLWGHYYVFCFSDSNNEGTPCVGDPSNWAGAGGTSFASPIMAGIQSLVNQSQGGLQGNPNYVYYSLAASSPAIFHNISRGDITVNCSGADNCFGVNGTVGYGRGGRPAGTSWGGALSVSSSSFTPAYAAGASWNLATGIGSVDAYQLVTNWPKP
jgi:subtilase family serine protease